VKGLHRRRVASDVTAFPLLAGTRNLGLLFAAAGAYSLWRASLAWDPTRRPFGSWAATSVSAAVLVVGIGLLWSYLFAAVLHPNEPIVFWQLAERKWRGRILGGCAVLGVASTVVLICAWLGGHPAIAGSMVGTSVWGDLIGVVSVTGGIRPMYSGSSPDA